MAALAPALDSFDVELQLRVPLRGSRVCRLERLFAGFLLTFVHLNLHLVLGLALQVVQLLLNLHLNVVHRLHVVLEVLLRSLHWVRCPVRDQGA